MSQDTPPPPDPSSSAPIPLEPPAGGWTILVCINRRLRSDLASCAARDSEKLVQAIEAAVAARGLDIRVERTVCMGRCDFGPTVRVAPGGAFHLGLGTDDVQSFLDDLEVQLELKKNSLKNNQLPPPGT